MSRLFVAVASGMGLGIAITLCFSDVVRAPLPTSRDGAIDTGFQTLLVALPPVWSLLLGALLGAAVGWALHRAVLSRVLTPFLVPGLAAFVFIPGVVRIFPILSALHGALLDALLIGAFVVALWRYREGARKSSDARESRERDRRTSNRRAAFLGVGAFCVYVVLGLRLVESVGLSGDEPHYLLITESVLRDADLRVDNNYFSEHYARFYRGKIGPHLAADSPYSVHGIGLPLLLLPGFGLFGLTGVIVTEAALGGLLVALVFRLAYEVAAEHALLVSIAFGFTAPALFLAVSTYPELPAALIVLTTLLALSRLVATSPALALGLGAASALLPFFHVKFAPLAALLVALLLLRYWLRDERAAVGACLTGAFAVGVVWLSFLYGTFGSIDPTASYGRPRVFLESVPTGVMGLLFDQEFGLIPASPFYLLGIAGLPALIRCETNRLLGIGGTLIVVAVLVPGAAHPLWTGGNSPPARFLFPALPVLAVASAALLRESRGRIGVAPWTASIIAASFVVAGAMVFLPGQPLYLNARDGSGRVWEALSSGWNVGAYLPSIVTADTRSLVITVALAAIVSAFVLLQALRKSVPLPPLALVVLLVSAAIDFTLARSSPPETLERRWVTTALARVHDARDRRFLLMPSGRALDREEVLSRLPIPLVQQRGDGDPRYWWSLRYRIPAGEYTVDGIAQRGAAICNGAACFAEGRVRFRTGVGLQAFRLRAQGLMDPPVLRLTRTRATTWWANQSVPLFSPGRDGRGAIRLHALDDGAYLDGSGFWVKGGDTALFAAERLDASPGPFDLEFSNGGLPNRVQVRSSETDTMADLAMAPWERTRYRVGGAHTVWMSVTSERGFRPNELDPSSNDGRYLGVLIHTAPFDLTP